MGLIKIKALAKHFPTMIDWKGFKSICMGIKTNMLFEYT